MSNPSSSLKNRSGKVEVLSVYALMVFKVFQQLFTYLSVQLQIFVLFASLKFHTDPDQPGSALV